MIELFLLVFVMHSNTFSYMKSLNVLRRDHLSKCLQKSVNVFPDDRGVFLEIGQHKVFPRTL